MYSIYAAKGDCTERHSGFEAVSKRILADNFTTQVNKRLF